MLDLSAYASVLLVHVVSGVFLVGSSVFAPVPRMLALEAPTLPELRAHVTAGHHASKWNPLAAVVLLASGVYLGWYGWWTQPWFFVALAAWLASTVLAVAVIRPIEGALSHAAQATGEWMIPPDADVLRRSRGWTVALASMLATDVSMLPVMYLKPGWTGGLVIVGVANVLASGALLSLHHARRTTATIRPALQRPRPQQRGGR